MLLRSYIEDYYNLLFSKENIIDVVVMEVCCKIINLVKVCIEVVEWDGQLCVECYFINYLGVEDNYYICIIIKKWLIGFIVWVYVLGVKFEIVFILEGS